METEKDTARDQAKSQLDHIIELVQAYEQANQHDEADPQDDALAAIRENIISVKVRGDWHAPGTAGGPQALYCVLLCTGGPACRIIGTLDDYQEPATARLQYPDRGNPWTDYLLTRAEEKAVLTFTNCFGYRC